MLKEKLSLYYTTYSSLKAQEELLEKIKKEIQTEMEASEMEYIQDDNVKLYYKNINKFEYSEKIKTKEEELKKLKKEEEDNGSAKKTINKVLTTQRINEKNT